MPMAQPDQRLVESLKRNWQTEMQGAATYQALADRETDAHRRDILLKLAEAERGHAARWDERLRAMGATVPADAPTAPGVPTDGHTDAVLIRVEAEERKHIAAYQAQAAELPESDPTRQLMLEMARDELEHSRTLRSIATPATTPRARLDAILRREKWHVSTGSWLGDAIYGVNDGLGAVFGIVSTVAGYSSSQVGVQQKYVLIAGLAGMLASALSMGSGAYLATKSEREVHEAELDRERKEFDENPDEEREELELFYQLKGFSPDEAIALVHRLEQSPDQLIKVMAAEELGISEEHFPSALKSALSSSLSTAVGASIPVVPFFFFGGIPAIILAALISLAAHFAVGAAKTLVTNRPWWASGTEMTVIGAVEGAVTFGIGLLLGYL
jgi:vacuolar iron transporter family protein